MSAKYTPPGSKVAPKFSAFPRRNRFVATESIKEPPPNTSSSELFPVLGETNGNSSDIPPVSLSTSTPPPTTVWGASAWPEQPGAPKAVTRTLPPIDDSVSVKYSTISEPLARKTFDIDPRFAIAAMNRRKREADELNSLNGYRDDYVYLHELDALERDRALSSDCDSDGD